MYSSVLIIIILTITRVTLTKRTLIKWGKVVEIKLNLHNH